MINPQELRIGNWVMLNKRLHKVDSIHESYGIDLEVGTHYDYTGIEGDKRIEPIPLTPEILEAAGFENRSHLTDYIFEHPKLLIGGWAKKFAPSVWGESGLESFGNELKYVHELQNVFYALTGTELKVSLTEKVNV